MNCSNKQLQISIHNSVDDLPKSVWKNGTFSSSFYIQRGFLKAIEKNHQEINFLYVVCRNKQDELIGFSNIQLFNFSIDELKNDWQNITKSIASVARKLRILPKEKPLTILNCGLPFVSGNHGMFLHPDSDKKKVLRLMIKSLHKYVMQNSKKYPIDIFIIKDFTKEDLLDSNELIGLGYYAFNVEPNMMLKIPKEWKNFNDYLSSLKTKFRVKAKRALKLSQDLKVHDITVGTLKKEVKELNQLYTKVTSKAGFNLIDFNLNTFFDLLSNCKENYFVRTYKYENKLVGFSSGKIFNNKLDAHFVGIDYKFNKTYAIYQRMLYDYISLALENNVHTINYGRTASEIKSSVGAIPEHLTVYIRHKKSITNKFLQLFLYRIQPSEFSQKFPFKKVANS